MTGDANDILARLKRVLPARWFGDDGAYPIVEALLAGAAAALAGIYDLWAFAKKQTRLATMTGAFLDLAAFDFFGNLLRRLPGELDPAYSRRIRLEVFRDRNTRHAIDRAVFDLTGQHPAIYEAWRPGDCGGWGAGGFAYGVAGLWGSRGAPFEVIVSFYQLQNYGIPNRGGWGSLTGAYGAQGNFSFVDGADIQGSGPTLNDVLAALDRVRTASVTYYVNLLQLGAPGA